MSNEDHRRHGRPWARRAGLVLIVLGLLGLTEVGLTMWWQEPFSTLKSRGAQAEVRREVDTLLREPLSRPVRRELSRLEDDGARLELLAERLRRTSREGRGLGRIEMPTIDVDRAFVEGTDGPTLERGPGHYPGTGLPGEQRTTGIAGHRTTFGAPFREIDALDVGDEIVVTMPYGRFVYAVERNFEVTPNRTEVVRDVGRPRLVLSACTPLFSSARRIIIWAKLVRAQLSTSVSGSEV